MVESLLFMASVMFFFTPGGWLLSLCTYWGLSFGFKNGLWVPKFKSRVTSKKSITFKFAVMVMVRPFINRPGVAGAVL